VKYITDRQPMRAKWTAQ